MYGTCGYRIYRKPPTDKVLPPKIPFNENRMKYSKNVGIHFIVIGRLDENI
jgi:hypothetical protein